MRALLFPLLLLPFMIPIPELIYNQITFPLQLFASQVAEFVLGVFQIPVLREGNILVLASQTLSVAEACSGIRSLLVADVSFAGVRLLLRSADLDALGTAGCYRADRDSGECGASHHHRNSERRSEPGVCARILSQPGGLGNFRDRRRMLIGLHAIMQCGFPAAGQEGAVCLDFSIPRRCGSVRSSSFFKPHFCIARFVRR